MFEINLLNVLLVIIALLVIYLIAGGMIRARLTFGMRDSRNSNTEGYQARLLPIKGIGLHSCSYIVDGKVREKSCFGEIPNGLQYPTYNEMGVWDGAGGMGVYPQIAGTVRRDEQKLYSCGM